MLDTDITWLETRHLSDFSPPPLFWITRGLLVVVTCSSLQYSIVERAPTSFNISCMLEIKIFFQTKMLNKRHYPCLLHVLTLLIQQMSYVL